MLGSRFRHGYGVDIMVTHSPAYGIHDGPDYAHTGFEAFNWLIANFKPRLFLHGHQHRNYSPLASHDTQINSTRILNVHPYQILDVFPSNHTAPKSRS